MFLVFNSNCLCLYSAYPVEQFITKHENSMATTLQAKHIKLLSIQETLNIMNMVNAT